MKKEKCKIMVEKFEKGWQVSTPDGCSTDIIPEVGYTEFIPEEEDPLWAVSEFIDGQSWDWKEQHGRFLEDFDIEVR